MSQGAPKFAQVWQHQWMPVKAIKRLESEGANLLTEPRLKKMLDRASEMGFEDGKKQGRFELRQGIEEGRLEPIPLSRQSSEQP